MGANKKNLWRWLDKTRRSSDGSEWYYEQDYDLQDVEEEWRDVIIDGINTKYQVSSLGRVKNPHGRKLRGSIVSGYNRISICNIFDKKREALTHRLIAIAFLGNPPIEEMTVDHINRDRLDNRVENLRWATRETQRGNFNPDYKAIGSKKPVVLISEDGHKEFPSAIEASIHILDHEKGDSNIARVCRGEQKTAYGYKWKYKNEFIC